VGRELADLGEVEAGRLDLSQHAVGCPLIRIMYGALVLAADPLQASARAADEANHQDPVMTRHMPWGKPGSVVKTCTAAARGTCARFKGETVI